MGQEQSIIDFKKLIVWLNNRKLDSNKQIDWNLHKRK